MGITLSWVVRRVQAASAGCFWSLSIRDIDENRQSDRLNWLQLGRAFSIQISVIWWPFSSLQSQSKSSSVRNSDPPNYPDWTCFQTHLHRSASLFLPILHFREVKTRQIAPTRRGQSDARLHECEPLSVASTDLLSETIRSHTGQPACTSVM